MSNLRPEPPAVHNFTCIQRKDTLTPYQDLAKPGILFLGQKWAEQKVYLAREANQDHQYEDNIYLASSRLKLPV